MVKEKKGDKKAARAAKAKISEVLFKIMNAAFLLQTPEVSSRLQHAGRKHKNTARERKRKDWMRKDEACGFGG